MNRNFTPTSIWLRSISAAAAVVTTLAIVSAIDGLATHYGTNAQLGGCFAGEGCAALRFSKR